MSVEESPEFHKSLNEACEKRYRGWLYGGEYAKAHSKDKIADTMEEIQRQREELEDSIPEELKIRARAVRSQAKIMNDPHMREITENLKRRHGAEGLICPVCGEGDHNNRMNGKPYCFMNGKHRAKGIEGPVQLVTPEKAKEWKPPNKKVKLKDTWELSDDEIVKVRGKKK